MASNPRRRSGYPKGGNTSGKPASIDYPTRKKKPVKSDNKVNIRSSNRKRKK